MKYTRSDLLAEVERRLLAGEDPEAIADDLSLVVTDNGDFDGVAVVLPGAFANDGNAEVEYPDVTSRREAAEAYVADGDWGEIAETTWIDVWAWRSALVLDARTPDRWWAWHDAENGGRWSADQEEEGERRCAAWVAREADDGPEPSVTEVEVDREHYTIALDPDEPECIEAEHDWRTPHEIVGGCSENPGVWGHGGGVTIHEICRHCGLQRHTDTWAQRPDTGEQGLRSVRYEDADDATAAWVAEEDAAMLDEYVEAWDTTWVDGATIKIAVEAVDDEQDEHTIAEIRAALPKGWTAHYTGRGDSTNDVVLERK